MLSDLNCLCLWWMVVGWMASTLWGIAFPSPVGLVRVGMGFSIDRDRKIASRWSWRFAVQWGVRRRGLGKSAYFHANRQLSVSRFPTRVLAPHEGQLSAGRACRAANAHEVKAIDQ